MSAARRSSSLPPSRWCRAALAGWLLAALAAGPPAAGQDVIDPIVDLDFDEPEAWAMKFFSASSQMTSLGPALRRDSGTVELGVELLSVPHLDQEQRTVGFGGFKEEDLNRSPVWARLRLDVALAAGWALELGWLPPVEIDGAKADLVSLGVGKVLWQGGRAGLGLRLFGQLGDVDGDFTCREPESQLPPGSPGNPFGCQGASADRVTLEHHGAQLVASYRLGASPGGPVAYLGSAWVRQDLEFQVDALTFGFRDRTLLRADGDLWNWAAGVEWTPRSRARLGVELFYSPLDVVRRGQAEDNDPLWSARVAWRHRVR